MVWLQHVLAAIFAAILAGAVTEHAQEAPNAGQPLEILLAAGDISTCGSKGKGEATANLLLSKIEAARKAGVKVRALPSVTWPMTTALRRNSPALGKHGVGRRFTACSCSFLATTST